MLRSSHSHFDRQDNKCRPVQEGLIPLETRRGPGLRSRNRGGTCERHSRSESRRTRTDHPPQPSFDERLLRESVARLAGEFGAEYFMEKTRAREPVTELWKKLGDNGYLGAFLPTEYGGGGQEIWSLAIVSEELAAAGCPMFPLVYSAAIVSNVLARHGSQEQKDTWLPKLAAGEAKIAFAITEPDAGANSHMI